MYIWICCCHRQYECVGIHMYICSYKYINVFVVFTVDISVEVPTGLRDVRELEDIRVCTHIHIHSYVYISMYLSLSQAISVLTYLQIRGIRWLEDICVFTHIHIYSYVWIWICYFHREYECWRTYTSKRGTRAGRHMCMYDIHVHTYIHIYMYLLFSQVISVFKDLHVKEGYEGWKTYVYVHTYISIDKV